MSKPNDSPKPGEQRADSAAWLSIACMVALIAAGCSKPVIETKYATGTGRAGRASLHGTGLLVEAFRQAGHEVIFEHRFSKRLDEADIVLWFPDDYGCLTDRQAEYIRDWLRSHPAGTWVYVRRDYQAVAAYVDRVIGEVKDARMYWRFRARQVMEHQRRRLETRICQSAWFDVERLPAIMRVTRLSGERRWVDGLRTERTNLWLGEKIVPYRPLVSSGSPGNAGQELDSPSPLSLAPVEDLSDGSLSDGSGWYTAQVLLDTEHGPFVVRFVSGRAGWGRLLLIANGSFLLNYGLIEPEHWKLVGALLDEWGKGKRVVFLSTEPMEEPSEGQEALRELPWYLTWPVSLILAHALWWGASLLSAWFPMFGPPARGTAVLAPSMGQHIEALGELLASAADREYSRRVLQEHAESFRKPVVRTALFRRSVRRLR